MSPPPQAVSWLEISFAGWESTLQSSKNPPGGITTPVNPENSHGGASEAAARFAPSPGVQRQASPSLVLPQNDPYGHSEPMRQLFSQLPQCVSFGTLRSMHSPPQLVRSPQLIVHSPSTHASDSPHEFPHSPQLS